MAPFTLLLLLGTGLLAAIGAGLAVQPATFGELSRIEEIHFLEAFTAAAILYAAAIWLVCTRPSPPRTVALIIAVAVLARLCVLPFAPFNSNDIYRYVWDGRVQAAGINPYRYLPVDPALAPLRDSTPGPAAIYPNINRASYAPTIYPPTAQALFALVGLTAPSIWTMKAVMAVCDILTGLILLLTLRAAGRPPTHILIWLWNPLPIWEFANSGHIDSPGITLAALAIYAAIRLRPALAGAALGAAVMVKFLPAALFPALWRRWDVRTPLAAAAIILAGYACYASVGWRVFGFLGGYVQEEGLETGSSYLLLRLAKLAAPLPPFAGKAYLAICLIALAALSLWIVRKPLPSSPAARADVIGWTASLLSSWRSLLSFRHICRGI